MERKPSGAPFSARPVIERQRDSAPIRRGRLPSSRRRGRVASSLWPHEEVGCFEVVDRNGVVGYMLVPDYAQALSARITDLEEQEERAAVSAMLEARRDRTEFVTGEEFRDGALAYLEAHHDEMMEAVRER